DLSHWFYHRNRLPWDLSRSFDEPEHALIDFHKKVGAGFYIPNLASFFSVRHRPDVSCEVEKEVRNGTPQITWRFRTPLGDIERARIWQEETYSWGILEWGIKTPREIEILGYAMSDRVFTPCWGRYRAWVDAVGDDGIVYLPLGYSGMGHLLIYWMGIEGAVYAATDWPDVVARIVDQINESVLALVDLVAHSPAEVVLMGDNFSGDVQPPSFFNRWSRSFYVEAIRRLHAAGKCVAVHIDGRLRGALSMIRETGADCADAVTPKPMGDLTAAECRAEAGPDFILSGGVSPDLWLPQAPLENFRKAVLAWLELVATSPRLIANAGDQVPPGAQEQRIHLMRDLVEKYGTY
ncbi:MAG: uroporphyrinogen decarboxylase family protein, partial [Planctomycetota bacterium]